VLRVNRQIYEEAHAVMLRSCTFILVSLMGSAGLCLKDFLSRVGAPVARSSNGEATALSSFKHYVAEFTVCDPNSVTSQERTVDQVMLINSWTWQQVVFFMSYVDVEHGETTMRGLSFKLVLKDSRPSELLRSNTERTLLGAIKRYVWNFKDFEMLGAQAGAEETMVAVRSDPWPTMEEMFKQLDSWREIGEETLKCGENLELGINQLQDASLLTSIFYKGGYLQRLVDEDSAEILSTLNRIQKHAFLCSVGSVEAHMSLALAWTPRQSFYNAHAVFASQNAYIALRGISPPTAFQADKTSVAHLLLQQGLAFKLMNYLDESEQSLVKAAAIPSIHRDAINEELEIVRALRSDGSWETMQKHGSFEKL
jgi:hypothetical protein